ncbi:DUF6445 family protein [Alteromonas sp. CI.11.F.A3]|uniref:DUF6445 family protein n=1 Tax=Alteromonas sp. CI.11.F.A3 TaxID=3079555 RepID=UPI002942654A|nr:DUF6445 family protein [Alteromonas sp. CI.11.F.A3]WOI37761.1 DUF6445 family protein [Alteromonas sp. CI.11.F.A3]
MKTKSSVLRLQPERNEATSSVRHLTVGTGNTPVFVIDNYYPEPNILLSQLSLSRFTQREDDHYPGLRHQSPPAYVEFNAVSLPHLLSHYLQNHDNDFNEYATRWSDATLSISQFSMATFGAAALKPIQCIPHIDTHSENEWAMVHYLFSAPLGGTAFYRHKETYLERVTSRNYVQYMNTLKRQATTVGLPPRAYIDDDSALFEKIGQVDAAFNRAIVYPANLLHSGLLPNHMQLPTCLETGRVTANACFVY